MSGLVGISACARVTALRRRWCAMSLARRYASFALLASVIGTLSLGSWVAFKIEQNALERAAGASAVYVAHFISPALQGLKTSSRLTSAQIAILDQLLASAELQMRVAEMKVWSPEGRILYSSNQSAIGMVYPIGTSLRTALAGQTASEFDDPTAESDAEFRTHGPVLEVYTPIQSDSAGEVIAVAEFYESGRELAVDLRKDKLQSWLVTSLILAAIISGSSALVSDGSRTIERQRAELTARISELYELMTTTTRLRERVERGARRAIEENERFLKLIGSDLHDGPAQQISLALLRLHGLGRKPSDPEVLGIRQPLDDAMAEIRGISAGLLMLDVDNQTTLECVQSTIAMHTTRTGTTVTLNTTDLPEACPRHIKICLCRFLQEGLLNAHRHAGGTGQLVTLMGRPDGISATVSDTGPGILPQAEPRNGGRLGLIGMRARIESVRGTLSVTSTPETGTTLIAWLPFEEGFSDEL